MPAHSDQAQPATILLVDDDTEFCAMMRAFLSRDGHQIVDAPNGEQGVRLASAQMPDLVLMDLEMPVLNGFDAVGQIRTDPQCARIPVVAISNHCWDFRWKDKALAAGFNECVDKGRLIDAVDGLLQRYLH